MSLSRRDAVKLAGAVAALPGSMWAKAPASSIHLSAHKQTHGPLMKCEEP